MQRNQLFYSDDEKKSEIPGPRPWTPLRDKQVLFVIRAPINMKAFLMLELNAAPCAYTLDYNPEDRCFDTVGFYLDLPLQENFINDTLEQLKRYMSRAGVQFSKNDYSEYNVGLGCLSNQYADFLKNNNAVQDAIYKDETTTMLRWPLFSCLASDDNQEKSAMHAAIQYLQKTKKPLSAKAKSYLPPMLAKHAPIVEMLTSTEMPDSIQPIFSPVIFAPVYYCPTFFSFNLQLITVTPPDCSSKQNRKKKR